MEQTVIRKFRAFDKNGNGLIDMTELGDVLRSIDPKLWTESRIQKLFEVLDSDNSRDVDYEEFVGWAFSSKPALRAYAMGRFRVGVAELQVEPAAGMGVYANKLDELKTQKVEEKRLAQVRKAIENGKLQAQEQYLTSLRHLSSEFGVQAETKASKSDALALLQKAMHDAVVALRPLRVRNALDKKVGRAYEDSNYFEMERSFLQDFLDIAAGADLVSLSAECELQGLEEAQMLVDELVLHRRDKLQEVLKAVEFLQFQISSLVKVIDDRVIFLCNDTTSKSIRDTIRVCKEDLRCTQEVMEGAADKEKPAILEKLRRLEKGLAEDQSHLQMRSGKDEFALVMLQLNMYKRLRSGPGLGAQSHSEHRKQLLRSDPGLSAESYALHREQLLLCLKKEKECRLEGPIFNEYFDKVRHSDAEWITEIEKEIMKLLNDKLHVWMESELSSAHKAYFLFCG